MTLALASIVVFAWSTVAYAEQPASPVCVTVVDTSGSGIDVPENRVWLLATADAAVAAHRSAAPQVSLSLVVYDETARWLGTVGSEVSLGDMVVQAIQPQRWSHPLPALEEVARLDGIRCVYHLTDGTFDLSPELRADEQDYRANVLGIAAALGARSVPIITVARYDDNGGLWRSVADASGGLYLVDPGIPDLQNQVASVMQRLLASPSPTAMTETAVTLQPDANRADAAATDGAGPVPTWIFIAFPAFGMLLACLVGWLVMRPGALALSGILEIDSGEEDHASN